MDEGTFDRPAASAATEPWPDAALCDPLEVAHFNSQALAAEGESARRWLHRYNPLRLAFVEEAAREAGLAGPDARLQGVSVLDVGCGTGIFCRALAEAGAQVCGIDPASDCIAMARRTAPAGLELSYVSGLVSSQARTFDIVTALEVIEHVPDPNRFLADCAARVRPGGLLILSTINRTFRSWAYAIVMAERVLNLLPRGSHDWRRFMRPSEISDHLEKIGFEPSACWGASFNLRTRMMERSADRSVNFLLAARKRTEIVTLA